MAITTRKIKENLRAAQDERAMRDRMNGIVRNDDGEVIMRNNEWVLRGLDKFFITDGVWSK